MIQVHTKLVRKKWFCFATFDGQDYSYTSSEKEKAVDKMKERLRKSGLLEHALWMKEEVIQPAPMQKQSEPWMPPKIDNNPIG